MSKILFKLITASFTAISLTFSLNGYGNEKNCDFLGRWNFGKGGLGPLANEYFPFIIERNKSFLELEKAALATGGQSFIFDNAGPKAKLIYRNSSKKPQPCNKKEPACQFFFK